VYAIGEHSPVDPGPDHCFIAETAVVAGKIRVGRDVSIWFGAVMRGDTEWIEIGDGSNVQDNAVLHTDPGYPLTIGRRLTVGHGALLHGCTIGDNSLIGMGAIVLNGAKIGKNCLIGAGALVAERAEIADGSLVLGAPAKVIRPVDDKLRPMLTLAAEVYV